MNATTTGVIAAAAIIIAFVAGTMIEFESDGDITLSIEKEGPLEQLGEKIDQAAEQ